MASYEYYVGVRVASAPAGEPTGVLELKDDKTILLKRPGDVHEKCVSFAWPSSASQTDVWNAIGEKAYETVVTNKEHACILVWGGRGSGKTHTVLGEDNGLVNAAMRAFAGNGDANMSVVMVRNDNVHDLVNPKNDNLRIKVDETNGVIFESAQSTIKIPTLDAAKTHLDKCMKARNDVVFAETASTHDSVFMIYHFGCGEGASFTVIECPPSDRVIHAEPTAEQKTENENRKKMLTKVQETLMEMSLNADAKAVGWKESKVTRFMQPAGGQAMEGGKGFFAVICCVSPLKSCEMETVINVTMAEGAMKQESLKTIGEYKLIMEQYDLRIEQDNKEAPGLQAGATAAASLMARVKAENADKAQELVGKVEELKLVVPRTQASIDAEMAKFKADLEKEKVEHKKYLEGETDRLQNLGKNKQATIDAETKKAMASLDAAMVDDQNEWKRKIKDAEAELDKQKALASQADKLRAEAKEKEKEAMKPVKEAEKELAKLKKELEGAGKCREDGMSDDEIQRMVPVWEARDELDELDRDMVDIAKETMSLDFIRSRKFGSPDSSSDDSDSGSDTSSESPSEKEEREKEEREEAEREALAEKARQEEAAFEKEHAFVKDAVYREKFLHDLVDKVMCYLEYGTNVAVLTSKGFSRHFMYMTRNRKQFALVAEVAEGQVPVKKDPIRVVPIEQIHSCHLGQHSPNFNTFLKKVAGRADPPRHEQPPSPEDLSPANMHRYYYRGFSFQMKRESEEWLDIICDTQTDFEALVVCYNRLTGRDCLWGRKMFIDLADRVDDLKAYERKLCEDLHLTPVQYFSAKEKVLADPEVLYMTLHDMRLLTTLDLYHCQCLMDVFLQQKWVTIRDLVYFKYHEDHRYEDENGEGEDEGWGEGEGEGGGLDM